MSYNLQLQYIQTQQRAVFQYQSCYVWCMLHAGVWWASATLSKAVQSLHLDSGYLLLSPVTALLCVVCGDTYIILYKLI